MNEERPDRPSELHSEIAAAREEAQRLEAARQHHFQQELSGLEPLKRLEHALWLMHHEQEQGAFGLSMPLSEVALAQVQQEAVDHIRETISGFDDPAEQVAYVRGVLLELDLMADYDGIAKAVREKISRILKHLAGQWSAFVTATQEAARLARAELEEAEKAWQVHSRSGMIGTATNWQHLARAAVILAQHPDLTSKDAFLEHALLLKERLGPDGDDPGSAIWRGVQSLGKAVLDVDLLPDHYLQAEGFQRLVFDLIRGFSRAD